MLPAAIYHLSIFCLPRYACCFPPTATISPMHSAFIFHLSALSFDSHHSLLMLSDNPRHILHMPHIQIREDWQTDDLFRYPGGHRQIVRFCAGQRLVHIKRGYQGIEVAAAKVVVAFQVLVELISAPAVLLFIHKNWKIGTVVINFRGGM